MHTRRVIVCLIMVGLGLAGLVPGAPAHAGHSTARAAARPPVQVFVEPDAGAAPLVAFIGAAQHQLDGEVYLASSKPVLAALEAAAQRGVRVRIALEQHPYGTGSAVPQQVFRSLQAHNVQVSWSNPVFRYTHAKYLVEPDRGAAWIGTMNWTTSAFASNREFGVQASDPAVVRETEAVFLADWTRRGVQGSVAALVVSPLNARNQTEALMRAARQTLDVYAEEVNDPATEADLEAAARRGVRVRLVCTGQGDIAPLRQAGVQVTVLQHPYIHAKAIVADGRTVFIGSENISTTSLDHNREMGLILGDPGAIAVVERAFSADVQGAGSPSPTAGSGMLPTPAPTPGAGQHTGTLALQVVVRPNPTTDGTATTVQATTTPGAQCTVRVVYASGSASGSSALKTAQTAGSDGTVWWGWKPSTRTPGPATATVRCTLGGATASGTAAFTVQ